MSFEDEQPGQRRYRTTREARAARRKIRRRRLMIGVVKGFVWLLVLSGVLILGIGLGRIAPADVDEPEGQVTIDQERGPLTVTMPVQTVERTVTVEAPARRSAGGRDADN